MAPPGPDHPAGQNGHWPLGWEPYQMVELVPLHGDLLEMELTLSMKEPGGRPTCQAKTPGDG